VRRIDGEVTPTVTATVWATPTARFVATPNPPAAIPTVPLPLDVRLEVTQGAPEYPLVLGKDTLVRVVLGNPNPSARPLSASVSRVELEIRDGGERRITLRKRWDTRHTAMSFFLPGHLLWVEDAVTYSYRFTVRLFNGDDLVAQASTTSRFLRNADLRLLLVPVMAPLRPADFRELARGLAIVSRDFPIRTGIDRLTPGVSAGLRYRIGAPLSVPARFRDGAGRLRCDGPSLLWLSRQLLLLQAVYNLTALPEAQADHVVGLVPVNRISPKCGANGLAERYGLYAWVALLSGHTGKALTMEIAHNLGAVSPLAAHHNPVVPYHSRNRTWYSPGLVDLFSQRFLTQAASVMFPGIVGSELETLFEPDDYAFLSGVLHQRYLSARRKDLDNARQRLMLVGALDREGHLEAPVALPLPPTAPRKPSFSSEYHLAFLSEAGAVLDQVGVEVNFDEWAALAPDVTHSLVNVAHPLPEGTSRIELRRAGDVLATLHPGAHPPHVTLPSSPSRHPDGPITIPVQVSDPDGDPVRYHVAYSVDGGRTFIPVLVDQAGSSVSWPRELEGPEREVLVRVVASDGLRVATAMRLMRLPVGDLTPLAAIVSPLNGQTVPPNTPVTLQALTYSPIGLNLRVTWLVDNEPLALRCASSLITELTPGTHRIAVVVTDAAGHQARDEVVVKVEEP